MSEHETLREAVTAVAEEGSIRAAARKLNIPKSTISDRLQAARERGIASGQDISSSARIKLPAMKDGRIIICSDPHYWPGLVSTSHHAAVQFAGDFLKDGDVFVMNGDVMDCAGISRYPPIGWEGTPTVAEELNECQNRLSEIERATFSRKIDLIWTLGNHDARFETRLATVVPEFKGVHGVHLKDHFPAWRPCWSVQIGDDLLIKHRFKGGIHARHNNTIWSGLTIVTGHTHRLGCTPFIDYNGHRYGIESGTLMDPFGPQSKDYTEDNPLNQMEGFVYLTYRRGTLLWPEFVRVVEPGLVEFRGELIEV